MEVTGKDGLRIARKYKPTIEQGFRSLYDLICPVNFGEFVPVAEPTVYYSVKEDEHRIYILYAFYHYRDWVADRGGLTGLDEHRHDFEGALVVVSKISPISNRKIVASVAHYEIPVRTTTLDPIILEIDSQGHAVHLYCGKIGAHENTVRYVDYNLVDMNDQSFKQHWETLKKHFNETGVKMPDQWNHYLIQRKYGFKSDGLIYTDPAKFLELAQAAGVFKP